jgi:hypothetical protein
MWMDNPCSDKWPLLVLREESSNSFRVHAESEKMRKMNMEQFVFDICADWHWLYFVVVVVVVVVVVFVVVVTVVV